MTPLAKMIRFYESGHAGDIAHVGIGLPVDEHPGYWKVYDGQRECVHVVKPSPGDIFDVPAMITAVEQASRAIRLATRDLMRAQHEIDILQTHVTALESAAVIIPIPK